MKEELLHPLSGPSHEDKLGALLWRTLDRLERSLADRRIEPAQAREVIAVVSELTDALPAPGRQVGKRLRHSARPRSWTQPRTHGSNP